MSRSLLAINILWAIADTAVCVLAVLAFAWGAYHFERWWLLLFTIVPLIMFSNHTLIVDADLQRAEEVNQNGREKA